MPAVTVQNLNFPPKTYRISPLACLAEEERLLAVLEALVGDVVHGGVAAVRLGVAVEALEDVLAHVEVEGVLGSLKSGKSTELYIVV